MSSNNYIKGTKINKKQLSLYNVKFKSIKFKIKMSKKNTFPNCNPFLNFILRLKKIRLYKIQINLKFFF